jgi:hypothetical protein
MNVNEKNGPVAEAERITREAALVAEFEEDRLIRQAQRVENAAVWIVVLLICAFLVGFGLLR